MLVVNILLKGPIHTAQNLNPTLPNTYSDMSGFYSARVSTL